MDQNVKKQIPRSSSRYKKIDANSPSIMQSLDSMSVLEQSRQIEDKSLDFGGPNSLSNQPDVTLTGQFASLNLTNKNAITNKKSFLLIDGKEQLQVSFFFFIFKRITL